MLNWRRISPWLYWAVAVALLAEPWVLGRARDYNVLTEEWAQYGGAIFFAIYLAFVSLHRFLSARLRDTSGLALPFMFLMGVPLLLAIGLMFFGKPLYLHGRFALERPALEAYVQDGSVCPSQQCLSEADVTAFVWGANNRTWSGVCHDPSGVMQAAERARNEDRRAGRPDQPRVFDAVAMRVQRLSGDWYACAASRRTLGVPLEE